jgi:hypothetical protein
MESYIGHVGLTRVFCGSILTPGNAPSYIYYDVNNLKKYVYFKNIYRKIYVFY